MRMIIAGSRGGFTYEDVEQAYLKVVNHLGQVPSEIVSGCARGVDTLGAQLAEEYSIELVRFPAMWDQHGKKAGYLRNLQMAEYGDILIAIWDGKSKGTQMMIKLAKEHGLHVYVFQFVLKLTKYVEGNNGRS